MKIKETLDTIPNYLDDTNYFEIIKEIQDEEITEGMNNKDLAIVVYNQHNIDEFSNKSGPLTKGNEYQCHYFAIVKTEILEDNSKVHYIFPILYFNYPQEVTGASISFEMKDVNEAITKYYDMAKELYKGYKKIINALGYLTHAKVIDVAYKMSINNNIHKHPSVNLYKGEFNDISHL